MLLLSVAVFIFATATNKRIGVLVLLAIATTKNIIDFVVERRLFEIATSKGGSVLVLVVASNPRVCVARVIAIVLVFRAMPTGKKTAVTQSDYCASPYWSG